MLAFFNTVSDQTLTFLKVLNSLSLS